MTEFLNALHGFFSGFGLPAYLEDNLPEEVQMPYITYSAPLQNWQDETSINVMVWYYGTGLSTISAKVDQIGAALGNGKTITCGNGCIFLTKGNPWAQIQTEEDTSYKEAYLVIDMQALFKN